MRYATAVLFATAFVLPAPHARTQAAPRRLPGFALLGQTARLAVYARPGRQVDAVKLDRKLQQFEQALDTKVASAVYYQYDYPEEIALVTGSYSGGRTYAGSNEVHSTASASDHELVHLVAFSLGRPGPFFQEGLAVALGDHGRYFKVPVDTVAKRFLAGRHLSQVMADFDPREPGVGYALAGSFVNRLLRRYGMQRLQTFFRATLHTDLETAFERTYQTTLHEEGLRWEASL